MFRGNGRKFLLFPINEVVKAIHEAFGSVIPELEMFAQNNDTVKIEGDPQNITTALFTVARNAAPGFSPIGYEPRERELRNRKGIVKAVFGTARTIVGENADEETYGIAIAYTFTMMALVLHGSRQRITAFAPYRFSVLMDRITKKTKAAKNEGDFTSILEQVHALDEETYAAVTRGELARPGTWPWFPKNPYQARIWAPEDHEYGLEACNRVRARLVAMYKDDGEYLREDEVVNRILEEEREKMATRDQGREIVRKHLTAMYRELKLPESVPVVVEIVGDGDGFNYSGAEECAMKVMCRDGHGFMANLSTKKEERKDPLSELLGLFGGIGVELVGHSED